MTDARSARSLSELPDEATAIVTGSRHAILSTLGEDAAYAVPVVFVIDGDDIVMPVDEKPKSGKPLKRVRNIEANGTATLLFERWDEDWTQLGWVMVRGAARMDDRDVREKLADRYPQYRDPELDVDMGERVIVLTPERVTWWLWQ
ncbi:MAG TPA: pyridoxamine 5'-phosphate oxidase family protein [Actinomycetota bacterium]|nr:pyridoxamine 5'-phosphate oxidase family protein [Actinomycetota bacterium]